MLDERYEKDPPKVAGVFLEAGGNVGKANEILQWAGTAKKN